MAALIIAWNDMKRTVRERQNLFWIFIAPLIFAVFFGVLQQRRETEPTVVSIVDRDAPAATARLLAEALAADGFRTRAGASVPTTGFGLVVPKGTADALASGDRIDLVLHAGAEPTSEERRLQLKIQQALVDLTLRGDLAESSEKPASVEVKRPLAVVNASLDTARTGSSYGFQHSIPAYLVMFTFMNLLVSGAGIAEERATGRLRRLALAPVTFRQIVLGKLLQRVAIGWAQMAYLLGLGVFVFHIEFGGHPATLVAFLSVLALAAASLGILIGTLFTDPDKCANLAIWSVMILSPLGGLWWPLEVVGPTLRRVADFVPTGWAMQAVNGIMAFGAGARDVAPFAAALLALFAVAFTLAVRRLRRQLVA